MYYNAEKVLSFVAPSGEQELTQIFVLLNAKTKHHEQIIIIIIIIVNRREIITFFFRHLSFSFNKQTKNLLKVSVVTCKICTCPHLLRSSADPVRDRIVQTTTTTMNLVGDDSRPNDSIVADCVRQSPTTTTTLLRVATKTGSDSNWPRSSSGAVGKQSRRQSHTRTLLSLADTDLEDDCVTGTASTRATAAATRRSNMQVLQSNSSQHGRPLAASPADGNMLGLGRGRLALGLCPLYTPVQQRWAVYARLKYRGIRNNRITQ